MRYLEEMMAERGVSVDHSTVHRWAIKLLRVSLCANSKAMLKRDGEVWMFFKTTVGCVLIAVTTTLPQIVAAADSALGSAAAAAIRSLPTENAL
ncbi:hypothetical protein [Burkholderia ubonensis]|uniref:hypothetical protein n=2 Tax=Burkholderia ubonensis TaxID=101571 RepID=UPI001C435F8C|nr:hypothetical protein [Burkholderia ubonensis]